MRLPGRTDTQIRIRDPRIIIVHVQTILVEFANIDKVAVRRLRSLPFSSVTLRIYKLYLLCILFGSI